MNGDPNQEPAQEPKPEKPDDEKKENAETQKGEGKPA